MSVSKLPGEMAAESAGSLMNCAELSGFIRFSVCGFMGYIISNPLFLTNYLVILSI